MQKIYYLKVEITGERVCQFSQEKTKSQSPDCHQKQQSRHTNSMDVKTILTQRGIDTLSTKCDPELTRATHN